MSIGTYVIKYIYIYKLIFIVIYNKSNNLIVQIEQIILF